MAPSVGDTPERHVVLRFTEALCGVSPGSMWLDAPLPVYGGESSPEMSVPAGPAVWSSLICLWFLVLGHRKPQTYMIRSALPGRAESGIRGYARQNGLRRVSQQPSGYPRFSI